MHGFKMSFLKLLRFAILGAMVLLCCACKSTPEESRWLLRFGSYETLGQVRCIERCASVEAQYNFTSMQGDDILFEHRGIQAISHLAGQAQRLRIVTLEDDSSRNTQQVRVGELIYAAYICDAVTRDGFLLTQRCHSQPAFAIDVQVNTYKQPIALSQWVPYLQQTITLTRVN